MDSNSQTPPKRGSNKPQLATRDPASILAKLIYDEQTRQGAGTGRNAGLSPEQREALKKDWKLKRGEYIRTARRALQRLERLGYEIRAK